MDAMEEQARAEGPQACCEAHDWLEVGNGRYRGVSALRGLKTDRAQADYQLAPYQKTMVALCRSLIRSSFN